MLIALVLYLIFSKEVDRYIAIFVLYVDSKVNNVSSNTKHRQAMNKTVRLYNQLEGY